MLTQARFVKDGTLRHPEAKSMSQKFFLTFRRYEKFSGNFRDPNCTFQNWLRETVSMLIEMVIDAEGPLHEEVLLDRVRTAAGLFKAGSIVKNKFDDGLSLSLSERRLEQRGNFIYPLNWKIEEFRFYGELDDAARKSEHVLPEEIQLAIRMVCEVFQVSGKKAIELAWHFLGFGRCTQAMLDRANEVSIDKLTQ
jgi:hypothetical protein